MAKYLAVFAALLISSATATYWDLSGPVNCKESCGCSICTWVSNYETKEACVDFYCPADLPPCYTLKECVTPVWPVGVPPAGPASCPANFDYVPINGGGVCAPHVCDYDTCPPDFGTCTGDSRSSCAYKPGYLGMLTDPWGYSTIYCSVVGGMCESGSCESVNVATLDKYKVNGIAAVNPAIFGLNQNRPFGHWGEGCSINNNICYYVAGEGGAATVAITDRCAGYCYNGPEGCNQDGPGKADCGMCMQGTTVDQLRPGCPCAGTVPPMYETCCGNGHHNCVNEEWNCDWCAANAHAHFDLDDCIFEHVCGPDSNFGGCKLKALIPYTCGDLSWNVDGNGSVPPPLPSTPVSSNPLPSSSPSPSAPKSSSSVVQIGSASFVAPFMAMVTALIALL